MWMVMNEDFSFLWLTVYVIFIYLFQRQKFYIFIFNCDEVEQNQHGQSDLGEVKEHVYNLLFQHLHIFWKTVFFMDRDIIIGLPLKYINHSSKERQQAHNSYN